MIGKIKNIHALIFGIIFPIFCINVLAIAHDMDISYGFVTANCAIGIVLGVIVAIAAIFRISDCNGPNGSFFG